MGQGLTAGQGWGWGTIQEAQAWGGAGLPSLLPLGPAISLFLLESSGVLPEDDL